MNKIIILSLLISFNFNVYANCASDPFSAECEASNANALKHELLCANGFRINSNGDVKDNDGNIIANVGNITSASKSINACKNYGGTTAYAKQSNSLKASENQNKVNSNSSASGVSASAAAATSVAISESPSSVVTGTSGSLGGGGGAGGGDVGVAIGGGGSGGSSCSSTCDCPNSMDYCQSGTCITINTSHPLCTTSGGVLVKGDATCQWLCSSGSLSCPAGGQVCGGGGPRDTTTDGITTGGSNSTTSGGSTTGGGSCLSDGSNCIGTTMCFSDCCNAPSSGPSNDCSHGGVCGGECRPNL
jgi:hypothetical protein